MKRVSCSVAVGLAFAGLAWAEPWPAFRGPRLDGRSSEKDLPVKWSAADVRWKVPLLQTGNSSPVVWNSQVFLSQPLDKKGHQRALTSFNRADGKQRWQAVVEFKDDEPLHDTNTFAAATPVTDGERVIVSFGSAGLFCYDMMGKEQWHYDLGKLTHVWGNASSPILHGDLVILWCGPGERQFLLALDKATGKKVWQTDEPGGNAGNDRENWVGSWSTPIIARLDQRDELIVPVPHKLKAFDPRTGKELWSCDGLGKVTYTSPAISSSGIVVAFSGYGGPALAVKAGGAGDVTKTHRLWHHKAGNPQRIGSPVIVGEYCYLVSDPGRAQCFDLMTGTDVWKKADIGSSTWSSLSVTAEGKLYLPAMSGEVYVLEASPTFKQLARNDVGAGERTRSSLALSDGEIFHRTFKHLYCIGKKK